MRRGGNKSGGFTIVETLIVLAVSASLAASAMLLISGRQTKTQFMVASNDLKQHIEQIINETRSGYYPGSGDFTCTGVMGGVPNITQVSPGTTPQGTNGGCIFLGKAMEFGFAQGGADAQSFATYPLVGNRQAVVGGVTQDVSSYGQAVPIALAPDSSGHPVGVDHSEFSKTENGLQLRKATYHLSNGSSPTANYAVFAFADSLNDYAPNATTGEVNSATEKLNLYYFSGAPVWSGAPPAPTNSATIVDGINGGRVNDTGSVLNSVDLCFGGVTGQTSIINITGLGQLSVKLTISTSSDPLC